MNPIYSFEPFNNTTQKLIVLALIFAIAALIGMAVLLRVKAPKKVRERNLLVAMLLFFIFLIGSGTAVFSWLTGSRIGPVNIYDNAVETAYGKVSFSNIKDAYVVEDKLPSVINPSLIRKTKRILVIEERTGKKHLLSEENYEISKIFQDLKNAVSEWEGYTN